MGGLCFFGTLWHDSDCFCWVKVLVLDWSLGQYLPKAMKK
jgi:hypothetical protein